MPSAPSSGLTDSPDGSYPDSSDDWSRTTALDLSGTTACVVSFDGVFDVGSCSDFARLEVAESTRGPWTEIGSFTGCWPAHDEVLEAYLPATFDGECSAYLRFRPDPDETYDGDGARDEHGDPARQRRRGARPGGARLHDRAAAHEAADERRRGAVAAGKVATGGRINACEAVR